MTTWTEKSVGELVLEKPSRSKVFEKVGLDYCCRGHQALGLACAEKGIEVTSIIQALEAQDAQGLVEETQEWMASLQAAVEHIVAKHHVYLREALPRLDFLTEKVANVHGHEEPRLVELRRLYRVFQQETYDHMQKEEMVLFPMCVALGQGKRGAAVGGCHGSVRMPIAAMMHEHENHGANLEQFRELTDGFVPPEGACNSWRAMLDGLHELEQDLHRHIHKENSWLFPQAAELEARG
jgi:regulator of cell morphogenesis and NO signaling